MKKFLFLACTALLAACSNHSDLPTDRISDGLMGDVKSCVLKSYDVTRTTNYDKDGYYISESTGYTDMEPMTESYTYSKPGLIETQVTSMKDSPNQVTKWEYKLNKDGKPESATLKNEDITVNIDFEYSPEGWLNKKVMSSPHAVRSLAYDAHGNTVGVRDQYLDTKTDSTECVEKYTIYRFDKNNLLTSETVTYKNAPSSLPQPVNVTFTVTKTDKQGNWIERKVKVEMPSSYTNNGPTEYIETRHIEYY